MNSQPIFGQVEENGEIVIYDRKALANEFQNFRGRKFVIKIVERDDQRTIPQMKYLHGGVLKTISDHSGYSVEVLKEYLKSRFAKTKHVEIFGGKIFEYKQPTASMKKKEMMEFIDFIRLWSIEDELGPKVYVPTSEEYKAGYHELDHD